MSYEQALTTQIPEKNWVAAGITFDPAWISELVAAVPNRVVP